MAKSLNRNIDYVVSNNLCLSCGMCYSICPEEAVFIEGNIDKRIQVNTNCTNCGLCYEVCPGIAPLPCSQKPSLIGDYIKCYTGYSKDERIRISASSAGIITSINKHALKKLDFDGVICIRQSSADIYQNEVILAQSDQEVESAMGSRYSPAFVCRGFKDLPLKKGGKYIFIGKPCDIHALKKAKKINNLYHFLNIALFCARTPKMSATEEIIKTNNIDIEQIKKIQYRGDGWPGYFSIFSDKNEILFKQKYINIWTNTFCKLKYHNKRCMLCNDATGEYADISVGDAWLPEYNGSPGHSVIIVRSDIGTRVINACTIDNVLKLEAANGKKVIESQKSLLAKKANYSIKRFAARLFFEKIPVEKYPAKITLREIKKLPRIIKEIIKIKI